MKYVLMNDNNTVYKVMDTNPEYIYPEYISCKVIECINDEVEEGWIYSNEEFLKPPKADTEFRLPDELETAYLAISELYEQNIVLQKRLEVLENG